MSTLFPLFKQVFFLLILLIYVKTTFIPQPSINVQSCVHLLYSLEDLGNYTLHMISPSAFIVIWSIVSISVNCLIFAIIFYKIKTCAHVQRQDKVLREEQKRYKGIFTESFCLSNVLLGYAYVASVIYSLKPLSVAKVEWHMPVIPAIQEDEVGGLQI